MLKLRVNFSKFLEGVLLNWVFLEYIVVRLIRISVLEYLDYGWREERVEIICRDCLSLFFF